MVSAVAQEPTWLEGGLDPDRPELVDRAWVALEACTGVAPPALEGVVFHKAADLGIYGGMTSRIRDERGEVHLYLREGDDPSTSAQATLHELAHHWVNWGPRVLDEGFTELLAECAWQRLTGAPEPGWAGPAAPVFGISAWKVDDGLDEDQVAARYRAATALARAFGQLLTPEQRWNPHRYRSWGDLWEMAAPDLELAWVDEEEARFETDGMTLPFDAVVVILTDVLLFDLDDDGLSGAQEHALGTNPFRWDTDGDGWWDGAEPPPGAVALPTVPSCLGVVAEADDPVLVFGGPDYPTPASVRSPASKPGEPVMLAAATRSHVRGWITTEGLTLAPCDDRPPVAGLWPMTEAEAEAEVARYRPWSCYAALPRWSRLRDTGNPDLDWWTRASCEELVPVRPGALCVGTTRSARRVRLELVGPHASEVTVDRTEVRPAPGEVVTVTASVTEDFAGAAWIHANRALDPCPSQ